MVEKGIDRYQSVSIEPAKHDAKDKLVGKLSSLFKKRSLFDSNFLKQFVYIMLNLTGGQSDEDGVIISRQIVNEDIGKTVILLKRPKNAPGLDNEVEITIMPSERKKKESHSKDPYLEESIYTMPKEPVVMERYAIVYPEKFPDVSLKKCTGEMISFKQRGSRVPDQMDPIDGQDILYIALNIFTAWGKSQYQPSPTA